MSWRGGAAIALSLTCFIGMFGLLGYGVAILAADAPAIPVIAQMIVWIPVVIGFVIVIPREEWPSMPASDWRLRVPRSAFRQVLTGPFADSSRPYRNCWRRFGKGVNLIQWALLLFAFPAKMLFLPMLLWPAAITSLRIAAYQGNPLAARLERDFRIEPRLRRNRRGARS